MSNIARVEDIYAAFGRGDVAGILSNLTETVDWEYGGSAEIPWLHPRRGAAEAGKFFEALGALELSKFQPKMFFENGNIVLVLLDLEAKVKATGRKIVEEDEVHIWHFDDSGRVKRFRHRADTRQHAAALRGAPRPANI